MNISDFYNNDLVDYASYSTNRMLPSAIDGLKNAQRKVIFTVIEKNIKKDIKVSQLASKVAEFAEYLHGEASLQGVICNLAQNFTGSNNINLLVPEGNFGTRFTPEPSASRYIYTYGSEELFELFNKEDNNHEILDFQNFEGHPIEPVFYVPALPLVVLNPVSGIATGFANTILPRNPNEVKKYIQYRLKHPNSPKKPFKNLPYFRGFKGEIKQGETKNQFEIYGVFKKEKNKLTITEVPIGYNLKSYIKVLDKLEEDGFFTKYIDKSEDDNFYFEVFFKRGALEKLTDKQIYDKFKLVKKVTENYTCINEENKVQVFDSIADIIDYYYNVKMKYLQKRKDYLIKKLSREIRELVSKYVFISKVINNELIISKRPDEDIYNDMDKIDKIIKINNSYDYLMQMPVRSMTQKRMDSLMKSIKDKKAELDFVKSATLEEMWLQDLKNLNV